MDYPKLSSVAWYSVIAACFLAVALWSRDKTGWTAFHEITLFLGVVFACIAAFAGLNYLVHAGAARYYELQRAAAFTERVRVLEVVSHMTPEQLAVIGQGGLGLEWIISDLNGNVIPYELRTAGGNVPVTFIETFISESEEEYLIPIRRYGEGTREREYAARMTNTFIGNGWAEAARGNLPARWINRQAAERLLERLSNAT